MGCIKQYIHTIIGSIAVLLGLSGLSDVSREMVRGGIGGAGIRSLYAIPVLLLSWHGQSKLAKYIAIMGLVAYITAGIFTLTRSIVFARAFFWLILAGFMLIKSAAPKSIMRNRVEQASITIAFSLLVTVVILVVVISIQGKNELAHEYWTSYTGRIESSSAESETRIKEAQMVMSQMTKTEWLVGRGVMGTWDGRDMYGSEREGVHIGYLHIIFKGGIILLLLFVVGPLFVGVKTLFSRYTVLGYMAAGILCQYGVELIHLGFPEVALWFVIICLAMGKCASQAVYEMVRKNRLKTQFY